MKSCQDQADDTAAAADIKHSAFTVNSAKMCQQNSIYGKTITITMLKTDQLTIIKGISG